MAERAFSVSLKDPNMNIPVETKPAILGALGGAIVLAFVGFSYADWNTAAQTETQIAKKSRTAVATALAPVCADNFKRDAKFAANLVELEKLETWSRSGFIEKGGWATMPGAKSPEPEVDSACAALIIGV